jgi:hypothetical protein
MNNKQQKYIYIGEADSYKYFMTLDGKTIFDRTQVFTDGKFVYEYSTGRNTDIKQVEKLEKPFSKLLDEIQNND